MYSIIVPSFSEKAGRLLEPVSWFLLIHVVYVLLIDSQFAVSFDK